MNTSHNYPTPVETTLPATRAELDVNLPVRGVMGEKARIICTDRQHPLFPIVVSVYRHDGVEAELRCVTRAGQYFDGYNSPLDIVNS